MRRRSSSRFATGFTLIELLTVIAIITILIGIVTPSLSAVRVKAKETATRAILNAINTGCEMFKNDENEYPKSNAAWFVTSAANAAVDIKAWEASKNASTAQADLFSGANLIVDAMVGRDALGYDPKKTSTQPPVYNRWQGANQRRTVYIPADRVGLSDDKDHMPKDAYGTYPIDNVMPIGDASDPGLRGKVFLDKFDYPILYYRANPAAGAQTQIIQTNGMTSTLVGNGVFDGRDNDNFTNQTRTTGGAGAQYHPMWDAGAGMTVPEVIGGSNNGFISFIRSNRTSQKNASGQITQSRPVNSESYLLISSGKDGRFGNNNDVTNFDLNDK